MSKRAITRVVRSSASVIVAGTLVAGVGVAAANADSSTEPNTVKLKVGSRDADRVETLAVAAARSPRAGRDPGRRQRQDRADPQRPPGRVPRARELRDDDLVKVVRVWHKVHVRTVRYDAPTRTRAVNSLKPGERKVARPGRDGIRKVRVRAEVHNGTVVDRQIRKRWERKPQPRVVLVGKRQRTVPGTGHLNWGALARCESGGNPNAVNPAGYYGLYQFSIPTWQGVGGSGNPTQASSGEQTYRAQKLYAAQGRSPWPQLRSLPLRRPGA